MSTTTCKSIIYIFIDLKKSIDIATYKSQTTSYLKKKSTKTPVTPSPWERSFEEAAITKESASESER